MLKNIISLCFLIFGGNVVTSAPIFLELQAPTKDEISFMTRFGYLPETQSGIGFDFTSQSISEAVRRMQAFASLPQTGVLDELTRSLFKMKRCGVKDIESPRVLSRRRRYILQQGWNKKLITYRVLNGSSTLGQDRVEELMKTGLAVWAPHGGLHFALMEDGKADIQVSFSKLDHGDGFPFDGPGHVVAHAFAPPVGAMHFDDDEMWSDASNANEDTTDFFAVAVHEIGHALGLSHSNVKSSVMYPYYQVPVERLHDDDILGLQELYLKNQVSKVELSEQTESPVISRSSLVPRFTQAVANSAEEDDEEDDKPDLCFTNYDTIQVIRGKIYVFEEEWMWVLSERKKIEEGYPKRFHEVFRGLPEQVNVVKTIYEKQNGNIVVFFGRRFWEFDSTFRMLRKGKISEYSIPSNVPELTTVFLSNYNNKTYMIEYERFWRFDEQTGTMDPGYPKEMSAWRQLPYPVDAALIWEGDTYFFRGPRFWRFDNGLVRAHQYYPVPTAQAWFPCAAGPDMDAYVHNDRP